MSKQKFMVVSGFLGSGKTTSMLALTNYMNSNGKKACIITNELGMNQVDHHFSLKSKFSITEVPDKCICWVMDDVVDKLNRLRRTENPDIIMSDIPGCGVGALDHVYHVLANNHADEFSLAPFTALVEPRRLRKLMDHNTDKNTPDELTYIMEVQLAEADLILLNKIDLLSNQEIDEMIAFLKKLCPGTEIIPISGKNGTNMDKWADYVLNDSAKLKQVSIDMDKFVTAQTMLIWYNRKLAAESINGKKDMNIFVSDFLELVKEGVSKTGGNIPHLKIFANSGDDYTKVSLTGIDCEADFARKLKTETDNLKVIINARAASSTDAIDSIMHEALVTAAKKSDLNTNVFSTECFTVMDKVNEVGGH